MIEVVVGAENEKAERNSMISCVFPFLFPALLSISSPSRVTSWYKAEDIGHPSRGLSYFGPAWWMIRAANDGRFEISSTSSYGIKPKLHTPTAYINLEAISLGRKRSSHINLYSIIYVYHPTH